MEKKILRAAERFSLFEGVREVTVALSGGADSMSLLYAMCALRDRLGVKVSAAHFNHMIRGCEADSDERFVRAACERLGIELFCERADVPSYARDRKLSVELAARELRYDFLERVAPDRIATAHTASDSLETALFNLSRGTGLKGLCGIPPVRGRLIRPIILCTRDDVERFCEDNGIAYVTDSTNLCDDYSRNRIRHGAVPVLKSVNSSAEEAAVRTFLSLSEDSDFLESTADREYALRKNESGLDIKDFGALHAAVAKRVIMRFYDDNFSACADSLHINGMYSVAVNGGKVSLPQGMAAVAGFGLLKIIREGENLQNKASYIVEITESVNDLFTNERKINNLLLKNSLDCDKIMGQLVVRTRESGDSIRLKNKNCTKTLKKLYNEYRIPLDERENNPVIADSEGVVWINGVGVSERCAVTAESKRIFRIKAKKQNTEN